MIFPTLLTYGGKNLVKPGLPILLPRAKGEPFIVKRSSLAQVAETFTVILSPWEFQLPERISNKAMVLPAELVADWESSTVAGCIVPASAMVWDKPKPNASNQSATAKL